MTSQTILVLALSNLRRDENEMKTAELAIAMKTFSAHTKQESIKQQNKTNKIAQLRNRNH